MQSVVAFIKDNWGYIAGTAVAFAGLIALIRNIYHFLSLRQQLKAAKVRVRGGSATTNDEVTVHEQERARELTYVYSDIILNYLKSERIEPSRFLDTVKLEFQKHPIFMTIDYESVPFPLKNGYFVVVSKLKDKVTLEAAHKGTTEIDVNDAWIKLSRTYFDAYGLPFRRDHNALVSLGEYKKSADLMNNLYLAFQAYYASVSIKGSIDFRQQLHDLKGQCDLYRRTAETSYFHFLSEDATPDDLGKVALNFDLIIATVHKVLLDHPNFF
jgi:hypothetical protein